MSNAPQNQSNAPKNDQTNLDKTPQVGNNIKKDEPTAAKPSTGNKDNTGSNPAVKPAQNDPKSSAA